MPFHLYNTAMRLKEEFVPQEPGKVKMYVCGPTVYDYFHIGNARAFVVFDAIRRVLEYKGYEVTFIQNITDVDDKIIARAAREGKKTDEVAQTYTAAFLHDIQDLGCKPATVYPKATEHIADIVGLIQQLVEHHYAYALDSGDVYFSVRSFPEYGRISGKKIEELEEGARVEVDPRKRDPLDFSLWKAAKPGEPTWPSPWGPGRPGWHIECSAMSKKYLGESFDIHGGGEDLIFPHHENENAQSECLTGKPLARFWLHNGFLKVDGEKMSKSLGNFKTYREIMDAALQADQRARDSGQQPATSRYDAAQTRRLLKNILRYFMLSAHYRSPLNFSLENLVAAEKGYDNLRKTMEQLNEIAPMTLAGPDASDFYADELEAAARKLHQAFDTALEEDMNMAGALGQIFELANKAQSLIAKRTFRSTVRLYEAIQMVKQHMEEMLTVLGLMPEIPDIPRALRDAVEARDQKRFARDWDAADQMRSEITAAWRFELQDTFFGTLCISIAPTPFAALLGEAGRPGAEKP